VTQDNDFDTRRYSKNTLLKIVPELCCRGGLRREAVVIVNIKTGEGT